jgi:hypothetical protein
MRPVFSMLTEDNDREVGRQTQSALTPHLASLIVLDRVLCSEQVRSPKRDLMFVTPYPRAILYTDVGLSVRELWTLRPRHDVQPTKVGFLAWCDQQQTENRADNESSELACSAASKNRADKELGRLVLLYGKFES